MSDQFSNHWNLDNRPEDVLYCISSYLDARFIQESLRKVCRRLYNIFSDQVYWKRRFLSRWGPNYRQVGVREDPPNWREDCYFLEERQKWKRLYCS
jgi:hypothetical protein